MDLIGTTDAIVAIEHAGIWGGGCGARTARGALKNRDAGAFLRGFLLGRGVHEVIAVHPATWKGGTPKAIHANRVQRDYPDLVVEGPPGGRLDALDALGILWWLERYRGLDP